MFTFIETRLFSRLIYEYLSEEEYSDLQAHLAAWPEAGDVVPGTGGVRKIRWAAKGRGKRGGVRVVYVARVGREVIWLLTIYAKNEVESIPANVLRKDQGGIGEMTKKRNVGAEILEGIRQIKAGKAGRVSTVPSVSGIRGRIGLSQSQFAKLMGVSVRTLQDWEQGRRAPSGPARTLLIVADRNPRALLDVA